MTKPELYIGFIKPTSTDRNMSYTVCGLVSMETGWFECEGEEVTASDRSTVTKVRGAEE